MLPPVLLPPVALEPPLPVLPPEPGVGVELLGLQPSKVGTSDRTTARDAAWMVRRKFTPSVFNVDQKPRW